MKTRLFATLTALSLSAYAGASAQAENSGASLAWQQPGYVQEVVVVTAPRPNSVGADETATTQAGAVIEAAAANEDVTLAWQEPGYVPEVVVVTASRSEVLAKAREAALKKWAFFDRGTARNALGAPAL
jgi:hypothetical protein